MEYRNLGQSGLLVSKFGFGTWTFGKKESGLQVGSVDLENARRQIDLCLDSGINFFDTADRYGESEAILGQAVKNKRSDVVIATKAGFRTGDGPNAIGSSRTYLTKALNASLERLDTDYIDLFQLHGWDGITPLEETIDTLDAFVRSGKVRYVGLCNFSAWHVMKCLATAERKGLARPISQQIHYTLLSREAENELLPVAVDQSVGAIIWSPLAGGLLTGKYRSGTKGAGTRAGDNTSGKQGYDRGLPGAERDSLENILSALATIAESRGVSQAQIALAWLATRPGVASVLIGAKTEEQLQDNIGAVSLELTRDEIALLDSVSAQPPQYPYWHQSSKIEGRWSAADFVALGPYQKASFVGSTDRMATRVAPSVSTGGRS